MEYYNYDDSRFYGAYINFINLAKIKVLNGEDEFLSSLDLEAIWVYIPSKGFSHIGLLNFLLGEPLQPNFPLKNFGEEILPGYYWGLGSYPLFGQVKELPFFLGLY